MRDYEYEALTATGAVTSGRMQVADEASLEASLRQRGDYLIRAEPVDPGSVAARPPARRVTDGAIARKELLAFTEYLAASAQAGLPILGTLEDLEAQVDSRRMKRIVREVRDAIVQDGKTLSEALAEHPKAFPPLYVTTVEAGESTGKLDYTLEQLVEYLEWQQEITLQIRQATLYPIILLAVMTGLVVMLLTYVYPKLLPIFTGFGVDLPLPTRIVLGVGGFLDVHWRWMIGVMVAVPLALVVVARTERGRLALDTLKLKLPVFGPLLHEIEMARIVTYMALFYRTGLELIRSFTLLESMAGNRRIGVAIGHARESVASGESMAQSLARTGLFPSVVIRSFSLGESTGALDESLERARSYYAREVPAAVRRMLAALQPLLIVVLGGVLGVIAMSIFLPIMSIYQSMGR